MGLFSLYSNKKSGGKDGIAGSSGNPDDRPRPRVLLPEDDTHRKHRRRPWTRGGISDFVAGIRRGKEGYFSPKTTEAVSTIIEGGAGANHEYNKSEITELAETLVDDQLKLGLTAKQAETLADRLTSGPGSS